MNRNLIGYSLKFQFEPDDTTLLNHYFRYYSIGEIKLNQETLPITRASLIRASRIA